MACYNGVIYKKSKTKKFLKKLKQKQKITVLRVRTERGITIQTKIKRIMFISPSVLTEVMIPLRYYTYLT